MDDAGFCIKNCKICGGYGLIRQDIDDIHDPNFGKLIPCPNSKYKHWDKALNIALEEAKILNWNTYIQTEAVKSMRTNFESVLERGYGWLYIYGEPGSGKTIMTKSAAVYSSQVCNFKTVYIKYSDLMNNLRSSFDEIDGQKVYSNKLEYYKNLKVLMIDELGRDRQTKLSDQSLFDIMDKRYQQATQKKGITVWVSNFVPEEILEPYQCDRIRDGRFSVLEITQGSVRPAMQYDEKEENILWWHK